MPADISLELSDADRKLLLRGLRYVRSAIMLEARDPTEEDEANRKAELNNIADIVERLNG